MTGLRNLKKRTIHIFLALLLLTVIWISIEYYFASEEYVGYYNVLNITVPRRDLASKLFKYLADGINVSGKYTKKLQSKGHLNTFLDNIPYINITFGSIFIELRDITPSTLNIFFIESKCATEEMTEGCNVTNNFILTARQCCSIESAARANPKRNVYILHTCSVSEDFLLHAPKYVQKLLLSHVNVHVVRYNMTEVFSGTPVQQLWNSKRVSGSRFPVEHSSDILRLTLLWRFGGMYCDLDVITVRPVDLLHTNYCGLESNNLIGNAVLNFEPFGYGHHLLTKALQHLNKHFNGTKWTANGPDLVTNLMKQECNSMDVKDLLYCSSFKIYHRHVLYPLHWMDHKKIFDNTLGDEIVRHLKKIGFTIHLWNKYTYKYKVQVGSSQAYSLLAKEFCPDVYTNCGEIF